jgi:hypothetical protein
VRLTNSDAFPGVSLILERIEGYEAQLASRGERSTRANQEKSTVVAIQKERTSQTEVQPVFSRHETFPPRNGWMKKGFDGLRNDAELFSREDCAVVLGVGKNMAKAIRYWCLAFKVCEEIYDKEARKKVIRETGFGNQLLSDKGWDPYLEDPGSLWLLHWKLLQAPCTASTWHFAFNNYRHPEFLLEDFSTELSDYVTRTWPDHDFADATLKNDVSCFTRMYCRDEHSKGISEETISSPFSDLGLLAKMTGGKHFAFHAGPKANLPNAIIAATALEYIFEQGISEKSIRLSRLVNGIGSPGLAFRISESCVYNALEEISIKRKAKDIVLSETAGLIQLQFSKEPKVLAQQILDGYYSTKGDR